MIKTPLKWGNKGIMSESKKKLGSSDEAGNQVPEESKERGNNPTNPGTSVNPLTLQVRNWGIVDFSKILKLRYKPD